ncbi:hypothetical protein D5S18_18640 [Nocardia panacis]|uniref:Ig-like domain repeat protein n=1 Tax=Nocardia panacis TaxID=2340916 RepID=A0A3A4KEW0_9NOCA|nr:hypothetical protein [Nocardia panacis]RJO74172.1 hypothetical protein D5S18_18640 [Nocardia panacis]
MTILQFKDKNDSLVIVPQDLACLVAPYGTAIPPKLTVDNTGSLPWIPGFRSLGELQRKAGAGISPDTKTANVEGYGSLPPRRILKTDEGITLDVTFQETRDMAYELFFGMQMAAVQADANGEWRATRSAQAAVLYYSVILIGQDGSPGSEIYPYMILPKTMVSQSQKFQFQMDSAIELGVTFTALQDNTSGGYVMFGQAGKGSQAIIGDQGFTTTTNEVQTLTLGGTAATGGTFTLSFAERTSAPIAYNATPAAVQSALAALPTIGTGNVAVSSVPSATTLSLGTTSTTGGTLAAGTYFWKVTAVGAVESTGSNEVTATTTGSTSSQVLTWTSVSGATGYKIYRGTSAGAENVLVATLGTVLTYTDTGSAGSASTPPTTTGTWAVTFQAALAGLHTRLLVANYSQLLPVGATVTVTETTPGAP